MEKRGREEGQMGTCIGFPGGSVVKNLTASAGDMGLIPDPGRSPLEDMATHSSILAGESHGQRSLAVYSPWGCKESDTTEQLSTYTNRYNTVCLSTYLLLFIYFLEV